MYHKIISHSWNGHSHKNLRRAEKYKLPQAYLSSPRPFNSNPNRRLPFKVPLIYPLGLFFAFFLSRFRVTRLTQAAIASRANTLVLGAIKHASKRTGVRIEDTVWLPAVHENRGRHASTIRWHRGVSSLVLTPLRGSLSPRWPSFLPLPNSGEAVRAAYNKEENLSISRVLAFGSQQKDTLCTEKDITLA